MKALLLTACFAALAFAIARPATPAIQYDEISRAILPGSTPAPPNIAFATDSAQLKDGKIYQTMKPQGPPPSMMAPQMGLGSIFGAIFNPMGALMGMGEQMLMGAIMGGMMGGATHAQTVESGRATRIAYYGEMMRYDNLAENTVTLYDAKNRTRTQIDLTKRQYKTVAADSAMPAMPSPPPSGSRDAGSANVRIDVQRTQGGDATIADLPATEYDTVTNVMISGATGSCHDMTLSIHTVEYAAKTVAPPGVSAPTFSSVLLSRPEVLAGEGCTAKVQTTANGPAAPANSLVLYSRTSLEIPEMAAMAAQMGQKPQQFWMVTERGNVRPVTASEAATLFSVPAGFARQQ
jgi:hypothetical protein